MSLDPTSRPHTIAELVNLAQLVDYDPSKPLREQLLIANDLRKQGLRHSKEDEYEPAFICLAKAVTLMNEKIPGHPEFGRLTPTQKKNLRANGNELLDSISALKLKIIDHYGSWAVNGSYPVRAVESPGKADGASLFGPRNASSLNPSDTSTRLGQNSFVAPQGYRPINVGMEGRDWQRGVNELDQQGARGREVPRTDPQTIYAGQSLPKSRPLPLPPPVGSGHARANREYTGNGIRHDIEPSRSSSVLSTGSSLVPSRYSPPYRQLRPYEPQVLKISSPPEIIRISSPTVVSVGAYMYNSGHTGGQTGQQHPPRVPEENESQSDIARTETYLQILRRFQGFSWPDSSASQNFDQLDLSTKVTWEPSATARGHFADVHKGRLKDAIVAVKLLRLPAYNPYTKEDYEHTYIRFFREMTIWAELRHTNIVPMIGFTAAKGMIGLVSLWHLNGNLVDHLAAKPDASVPDLMLDVAEGTHYLHDTAHLIHGDLKGMNILINEHGIACLTDFGISQQMDDLNRHTGFTTVGAATGTTHWMAPEVMEGEKPKYHSDVYSCAGVFLEICARKCPFHYVPKYDLTMTKLRGQLPARSHYPELDGKDGWWSLFSDCWNAQPSKRPTIRNVVQALYDECDLKPRPPNSVALRPVKY